MGMGKDRFLSRFKWPMVIIYIALMAVVLLALLTEIFETPEKGQLPDLVWLLGGFVLLITIVIMLSKILRILDALQENSTKLEKIIGALEKIRAGLEQINQRTHLSETAKAIAFRDADRQSLREAVLDKLQQQDFVTAYEIIDEIAHRAGYQELAEQLRAEADKYHDATDQERMNQVITHIEKLFEDCQWAKASTQIEKLIKAYPDSEKAKAMRQQLLDKKEERKKILLTAWDDAVKRRATDRSLEILKELDLYLTPNEALALQEAARDVFKSKLHNLGVQFSLAVSGKQWHKAVEIGRQIIRDFPNSKMSKEIRERMDILKQKVQQQGG
ncbi:MAG: hypothetical protein ACYS6W_01210 [Planctomycetota bacterium]|jgi:hypothetical protein